MSDGDDRNTADTGALGRGGIIEVRGGRRRPNRVTNSPRWRAKKSESKDTMRQIFHSLKLLDKDIAKIFISMCLLL